MASPDRSLDDVLGDLPAEKLNQKLSDDDLKEISKTLAHWRAVSPWLGLTETEEEEVSVGPGRDDIKRQRIDALRKWKERQNDKATYRSLIEAFYRAQRLDLVDITVSLLLTPRVSQSQPPPNQSLPPPNRSSPPTEQSPRPSDQSAPHPNQSPLAPNQLPLPPSPLVLPLYHLPLPPSQPLPSPNQPPHIQNQFPPSPNWSPLAPNQLPLPPSPLLLPLYHLPLSPPSQLPPSPNQPPLLRNEFPPLLFSFSNQFPPSPNQLLLSSDQFQLPPSQPPLTPNQPPLHPNQSLPSPNLLPPSPSQSPPPPLQSPPGSPLAKYGEYLKERYRQDSPIFSVQWPPMPIRKAFNLALIHPTKVQHGQISDELVRMIVAGKVDDILHVKKPVKLVDIFKLEGDNQQVQEDDRKVILVEGAPGSGKSTLSSDICKRWGAGELFQEYDAVILVQLRDPEVQAATTLAELLPAKNEAMAESIASQITECEGEKVLFVLDGWDELPRHLQDESLYRQLITSVKKVDLNLHGSAVIVTSRPTSSGKLHPLVSSRIEIIGFTPEELRQYFTECLSNNTKAVEALLERIEENPVVASSCYLPLNAAITAHLFLSYNQSLPNTVHGIFNSLILCHLCRYRRECLGLKGEEASLESLNGLPKSLDIPFRQLCSLAFLGVMEDRVTFSSTDLEACGINTDMSALGLIQVVPSMISQKVSMYYSFLHLQIQELLAAYHISSLQGSEQISLFQELFKQPRFSAVFQFYAGITRFQSERKYLSKLASTFPAIRRFVPPLSILNVITNMIQRRNKQLLLSVIRCLFEADDPSLCNFVVEQLNGTLDLRCTTLSPLDCLSVGYFLSCVCATTSGRFAVGLTNCSIDAHCCKFLMRGLSRCSTSNTTSTGQLALWLSSNEELSDTGASVIAEGLRNTKFIHLLSLGDCSISDEGVKSIGKALLDNNSLEVLWLNDNDGITEEGVTVLTAEYLKTNRGLLRLILPYHLRSAGVQESINAVRSTSGAPQIHIDCIQLNRVR